MYVPIFVARLEDDDTTKRLIRDYPVETLAIIYAHFADTSLLSENTHKS